MKSGAIVRFTALLAMLGMLSATAPVLHAQDAAAGDKALREKGRALFREMGCFQCHSLEDADANGAYAPALDGNAHLTRDFITTTLTEGRGDMPSFAGLMSKEDIALLAAYLMAVRKPPEG